MKSKKQLIQEINNILESNKLIDYVEIWRHHKGRLVIVLESKNQTIDKKLKGGKN